METVPNVVANLLSVKESTGDSWGVLIILNVNLRKKYKKDNSSSITQEADPKAYFLKQATPARAYSNRGSSLYKMTFRSPSTL